MTTAPANLAEHEAYRQGYDAGAAAAVAKKSAKVGNRGTLAVGTFAAGLIGAAALVGSRRDDATGQLLVAFAVFGFLAGAAAESLYVYLGQPTKTWKF